jgi:L-arabinose transport system substrate-binding protein
MADGKPLADVPHMGISATKIGEQVGQAIVDEAKKRGWDLAKVGAIRISYDQLPTAKDRVDGATKVLLKAAGFPSPTVFDAPQAKTDTEAALNAATITLNAHPDIKHWVAFGLNDEAALGAVRATETAGIAGDVIAVGIGGADSAINEFKKPTPTGFFGTVIISPKRHGYETSLNMYAWIANNKAPEPLTLTSGSLAKRDNYSAVRKDLGLE